MITLWEIFRSLFPDDGDYTYLGIWFFGGILVGLFFGFISFGIIHDFTNNDVINDYSVNAVVGNVSFWQPSFVGRFSVNNSNLSPGVYFVNGSGGVGVCGGRLFLRVNYSGDGDYWLYYNCKPRILLLLNDSDAVVPYEVVSVKGEVLNDNIRGLG